MLRNYFLISLRSLRKHLTYSAINIFGLGLGLGISLLLVTWIRHELSYDQFHHRAANIYRASMEYSFGGQTARTSVSPTALLPTLQKNFAEIEDGVRVYNPSSWNPFIVRNGEKVFQEARVYYADSTFFNIFSFDVLKGIPSQLLTKPNSIVLTETSALKYFGTTDVLDKTLLINNNDNYLVTGLVKDAPSNSILQFDFLASFSSLKASKQQIWWSANYETYLLINQNANLENIQAKTNTLVAGELSSELTNTGDYVKYNFIPLTDIYLRSDMNESVAVGDIKYVYIFGTIALLVLIIAVINYVNLATAKATERAKEVGIRKVVGALRNQLFFQFIGESTVITMLGLALSYVISILSLPFFNEVTGKQFTVVAILNIPTLVVSLIAALAVGIFAGAYPAIALSSFKPVSVLKGSFKTSAKGAWLRQSLVIFQFSVSILLIVSTIVIVEQMSFIQNKKLGFDKENTIVIPLDGKTAEVYSQIKSEIIRKNLATGVGRATESPANINGGYSINLEGHGDSRAMIVTAMSVDAHFIPTLGMKILDGRNFSDNDFNKAKTDTVFSFIVNEETCRQLSIQPDKAVGERVNLNGRKGEITGVVADFYFKSFHEKITPLVFFNDENEFSYIFVKMNPGDSRESLAGLETILTALAPHKPFEYKFLDQQYNTLYSSELRMTKISGLFSFLAIIIACLGLVGLVTYTASQRIKEIGVRKVLGASVSSVVVLITRDFFKLVVIALVLGIPAAYYIIQNLWLDGFAYRISVGWLPATVTACFCLLIAFGAAGYQSIKAAMVNPVDTLRNE